MRRFRLSRLARGDIAEIREYIAQDNATAADRVVDHFFDAFYQLASTPGIGRAMPKLGTGELRVFPVGNYVVFYRRKRKTVEIARVLHGARDFEALF